MDGIVETYEEEVVVAPKRRLIHVVEDVTAHIEAWHGGRLVTEIGGWSSTEYAIREAAVAARRFGVNADSTMSIVVREEISRRRVVGDKIDRDRRGEDVGRAAVVAQRYVHDVVRGEPSIAWRTVGFEWTMPVMFRKATDWPGHGLDKFFRPLGIRGWSLDFLHGGYGYRGMKVVSSTSRLAREGEMPKDSIRIEKPSPSQCWVVVVLGTLDVAVSPEMGPDAIIGALTEHRLEVDVELDRDRDGGVMYRANWAMWVGPPAAKMTWMPASEVYAKAGGA